MNIRETGSIDILRTIVHVIDQTQHHKALVSNHEIQMDQMDSRVRDFIQDHIRKSIKNPDSKLAKFSERNTHVQRLVNRILQTPDANFIPYSQNIAELLYNATPANATPGCIIAVIYTNSTEHFLGIIKLDKNDAIAYEKNANGFYELVYKGNSLPLPNKRNKLLKFATLRDTDNITDQEWDIKPGLIVLDKQVENLAQFFYRTFLEAQFLLTDDHKSEKLVDGLNLFLNTSPKYSYDDKQEILRSFGNRLINNEELTVEDAGQQILAKYHQDEEELAFEVERLESLVLQAGMGDTNLRGVMTPKIEKQIFGIQKINTLEGVHVSFPGELLGTQVEILDNESGESQDIIIKGIHIRR